MSLGSNSATASPPFRLTGISSSVSYVQSGIGNASVITPPFFHGVSGSGGFSANASLSNCTGSCSGDQEVSPAQIAFSVPLDRMLPSNPLTSSTNVTVRWSLGWTTHVRYSPGTCSPIKPNTSYSCLTSGYWLIQVMLEDIYDKTTGRYYAPSNMAFMNWTGQWGRGDALWAGYWYGKKTCIALSPSSGSQTCTALISPASSHYNATQVALFTLPPSTKKQDYLFQASWLWSIQLLSGTQNAKLSGAYDRLAFDMSGPAKGNALNLSSISFS